MLKSINNRKINVAINLTQHSWAKAQVDELHSKYYTILDLEEDKEERNRIKELLTFDVLPTREVIKERAKELAAIAAGYREDDIGVCLVMIGGAPWFMSVLEKELLEVGCNPIYAFSQRVSEEVTLPDGTVEKRNVFRHEGFVFPQA